MAELVIFQYRIIMSSIHTNDKLVIDESNVSLYQSGGDVIEQFKSHDNFMT